MSEELEWELYEMFEGGLFAFPVADHRSARQIVRHLLRRTVLYEEIADAIEESVYDLILWMDSNGHSFIGEWVMTWINEEREEYFREHGGIPNEDGEQTHDFHHDHLDIHAHNDDDEDSGDRQSMDSETQLKTAYRRDSDGGDSIRMIDDTSTISTTASSIAASVNVEDKDGLSEQRKREYEMMSELINVYRKRIESYDEDANNQVKHVGESVEKNQLEQESEKTLNSEDNDNARLTIDYALDRDAKIKKDRINKQKVVKSLDNADFSTTAKKNSFKERKKQLKRELEAKEHKSTEAIHITLTPEPPHREQFSPSSSVLTLYHKRCSFSDSKSPNDSVKPGKMVQHALPGTSQNVRDHDLKSSWLSHSDDALCKTQINKAVSTKPGQSLQTLPLQCHSSEEQMQSDNSSTASSNTLVPSVEDLDSVTDINQNNNNKPMHTITTIAQVHDGQGNNGFLANRPYDESSSTSSTLSSTGSFSKKNLKAPEHMNRLDVDHQVSSFVVRSGKLSTNKTNLPDPPNINTPPANLKDYSDTQTLLGRSRVKYFASRSKDSSPKPTGFDAAGSPKSVTSRSSQHMLDLKDYFPPVDSSPSPSISSDASILTCSKCGSRFSTPTSSITESTGLHNTATLPVCEQCQCVLVHYQTKCSTSTG